VLTHRLAEDSWLRVFTAHGVEVENWNSSANLDFEQAVEWAKGKIAGAKLATLNDWRDCGTFQNETTYEVELH
jgi:hypothetical protein